MAENQDEFQSTGEAEASTNFEEPTPSTPSEPSKPSFLQRALRWLLGGLILAGLGAVVVLFTLYLPLRGTLESKQQNMEALAQQATADQGSAQSEIQRLSKFETENENLREEIENIKLYNLILKARVDITNAKLALLGEDPNPSKASLALSNTPEILDELEKMLPVDQREEVRDMKHRLELITDELEDDTFAALSDLDVLANLLLELENAITG